MLLRDPDLLREQCFIEGNWVGIGSDAVTNPATSEVLAHVPRFGAPETEWAVAAAGKSFPAWSRRTAKNRADILRAWFELVIANSDDLALILTSEQGKPLAEARGEIGYAASFIEFYAEEARRIYGEIVPSHLLNARILVMKQPVGVVAAITPWNFPAAMITRKVAPALAAGCTAIVKPAPETPLTALAFVRLAERAGVPAGVLNVVTGDAAAIGGVMTAHPDVRAISFTGSTAVGKMLMRQAADTVKKVGLELGGNAPFIVFDDADLDAAADGAVVAKFRNMGQTCVCANRIYVQDNVYDAFVEKFAERMKRLVVGNGAEPNVDQGPLINSKAVEKVEAHVADARSRGARVLLGGKRHALGGTFFEPTLIVNVTPEMVVVNEETFGPVAAVQRFRDEGEVIRLANATPFGLASYFYARDLGRVFRIAGALECGMVGVNSAVLGVDVAPFGGTKESGLGREGSRHGIDEYVELKYVLLGLPE